MEKLDNVGREELKCLKCLVLVRPTSANMELLVEELRAPKYSQYHICRIKHLQYLIIV